MIKDLNDKIFKYYITWLHNERDNITNETLFRIIYLLSSINLLQHQKSIEINQNYIHWIFPYSFYKYAHYIWVCRNCYNTVLSYDPHFDRDHLYTFPLSIAHPLS